MKRKILFVTDDGHTQRIWTESVSGSRYVSQCVSSQEEAREAIRSDGPWDAVAVRAYVAPGGDVPFVRSIHSYRECNTGELIRWIRDSYPEIPVFGSCMLSLHDRMKEIGCVAVLSIFELTRAIEQYLTREALPSPAVISS